MSTTTDRFDGFGEDMIPFFEGIAADNSKTYWQEHRPRYEAAVAEPLRLLLAELEEEFGEALGRPKVLRPYRDVRFSKDKRPYRESAAAVAELPHGMGLYLEVSPRGMFVGGGLYEPGRDQLDAFRRLQDETKPAAEFDDLVARCAERGYHLSREDALKTAPRGWAADHPRIELLRLKRVTVFAQHEPGDWLHTREAVAVARAGWGIGMEVNEWVARRVGPSAEVRGR